MEEKFKKDKLNSIKKKSFSLFLHMENQIIWRNNRIEGFVLQKLDLSVKDLKLKKSFLK